MAVLYHTGVYLLHHCCIWVFAAKYVIAAALVITATFVYLLHVRMIAAECVYLQLA